MNIPPPHSPPGDFDSEDYASAEAPGAPAPASRLSPRRTPRGLTSLLVLATLVIVGTLAPTVASAVDRMTLGPGLRVEIVLSDPARVILAAGVVVVFALMLLGTWLYSRHLRTLLWR